MRRDCLKYLPLVDLRWQRVLDQDAVDCAIAGEFGDKTHSICGAGILRKVMRT